MFGLVKIDKLSLSEKINLLDLDNLSLSEKMNLLDLDNLSLEELLYIRRTLDSKLSFNSKNNIIYSKLGNKYKKIKLYVEYSRSFDWKQKHIDELKTIINDNGLFIAICDEDKIEVYIGMVDKDMNVIILNVDNNGAGNIYKVLGNIDLDNRLFNGSYELVEKENMDIFNIITEMLNLETNSTLYDFIEKEDFINDIDEEELYIIDTVVNEMRKNDILDKIVNIILNALENKGKVRQKRCSECLK